MIIIISALDVWDMYGGLVGSGAILYQNIMIGDQYKRVINAEGAMT